MSDCIFCQIVDRKTPAKIIYENENVICFLPKKPEVYGHTLVVPKKHYADLYDIPADILCELVKVSQKLTLEYKEKINATGINLMHASGKDGQQSVFHFHFHLLPRFKGDGLDIWPTLVKIEVDRNYFPKGKLLWDSWLIEDDGKYHIFYLQADPSRDPEERHNSYVTIGHAVSEDLINWEELPTALKPGKSDSWDDLALWTGSVIKKENKYYMFYTGRNKDKDKIWIQKIGLAVSGDLITWEKIKNNPILEAQNYYYIDNQKNKLEKIGAWRDPFIFQDPISKKYYMTISARENNNKREYNGCVAIAESENLLDWKILSPIFSPNIYDEIETTQIIFHKGYYYLFFSTHASNYEPNFAKENGSFGGLHCYYSDNLFGFYKPVNNNGVVLGNGDEMYDIRLLHDNNDEFFAIGFLNKSEKETFIGKLTFPFKIKIEKNKVFRIE